ncbi:MAG: hypothetical protein HFJ46_05735 [Clostridia bacterium]|jgi:DNA-binding transcriptional MocR family regulator|nr:hypothetical protein [Clostridia bacterium]
MVNNIEHILNLQRQVENGTKKLDSLSDEELIELDKLYDQQLKDIEKKYEHKKNVFKKVYLEYKSSQTQN